MTPRFMTGLLAATFLLALAQPVQAAGSVSNGDFENGSSGWTAWGSSGCTHAVDGAPDGTIVMPVGHTLFGHSYHLADSSSSVSCGIYQDIPASAGETCSATASVHVHSGLVQLYVRWIDSSGNDVVSNFPQDTSFNTGYQTLNAQGTAPSGTSYARIWFYVPTVHTGDVHIDNVVATCA